MSETHCDLITRFKNQLTQQRPSFIWSFPGKEKWAAWYNQQAYIYIWYLFKFYVFKDICGTQFEAGIMSMCNCSNIPENSSHYA